MNKINVMYMK